MLTLSNYEVWSTLKSIAETAYPDRVDEVKTFSVEVIAKEQKSFHGDYHLHTRKIRIFNLSRKTASIIKTTIHELAHHLDCCFDGRTGHDVQFYTKLKHLLETAHCMEAINLADVVDEIDSRDMRQLVRLVGEPQFAPHEDNGGLLIKIDNAFSIKDELKERGYRFSPTERVWILEADQSILEDEQGWLHGAIDAKNVQIVPKSENRIESIYFCVLGKKGFYGRQDELKASGFRWHEKHGWYKRIPAAEKKAVEKDVIQKFGVTKVPFRGAL